MPRIREIKFEDCFNLPNPGLRSYFGNVVKGQPDVYRSTFAKGESTQSIIAEWNKELVSISDKWPSLMEFENDLAKKVGPMSVELPLKERLKDIESYYEGVHLPSKPLDTSAIAATWSEWSKLGGLQVRRQRATVDLMKKSTNSGSPYFTKRKNVLHKTVYCDVLGRNGEYIQYLGADKYTRTGYANHWRDGYYACAVLGWRGQEGGPAKSDVKQRVVWMFPFAVNICELMVYQPLIEAAQLFNLVPAWVSMESVDREITFMFDTKNRDDLVVCTDFTAFDQHFNHQLQDCARQLLERILTPGEASRHWIEWIYPIKYDIPLAYDYGSMKMGRHGMASGSGGTNADETLAHRALQYEAAIHAGARLNPHSQCLGDDGVLTFPGITVDGVMRSYTSHGLEMNESKQYVSTQDCVYLRRWHHKDYRVDGVCAGVYSTCRALGRLIYHERYYDPEVWGPEMVALRQLSIIENVKYHPLRDQFAEFCMKRDKYRLGIDIPGFLDNLEVEAQKAIDYMSDFMGYTKTMQSTGIHLGISNWWIVKYLKSRA
nr:RNA-dependent RNA polymerase [Marmot picobirnavirus]